MRTNLWMGPRFFLYLIVYFLVTLIVILPPFRRGCQREISSALRFYSLCTNEEQELGQVGSEVAGALVEWHFVDRV